jgi:uncharacterized membrane protein
MTTTVQITGRDYRDIIAGGLMLAFGLFCALYAQDHYKLGSATRMGPGWFPMYLGYLLTIIGAVIMVPAFFRKGEQIEINYKAALVLSLGVVLFAAAIKTIGLVPAILLQIGVSVLADDKLGIKGTLILAAATALFTYLVFSVGLELNLEAFIWPFGE